MVEEIISQEIEDYVSRKKQFEKDEDELFNKIRGLFSREVKNLNSKLPLKYQISSYSVYADSNGKPGVDIDPPRIEYDGIEDMDKLVDNLNKILEGEYKKIQEKYGFKVNGFVIVCMV